MAHQHNPGLKQGTRLWDAWGGHTGQNVFDKPGVAASTGNIYESKPLLVQVESSSHPDGWQPTATYCAPLFKPAPSILATCLSLLKKAIYRCIHIYPYSIVKWDYVCCASSVRQSVKDLPRRKLLLKVEGHTWEACSGQVSICQERWI
jgi:hypothetical protein